MASNAINVKFFQSVFE